MKVSIIQFLLTIVFGAACFAAGQEIIARKFRQDKFHDCGWRKISDMHAAQIGRMEQARKEELERLFADHNAQMNALRKDCLTAKQN